MNGYYKVIDQIKAHFEANSITNTVSFGDETNLDLNKTTIFPLTHFDINSVEFTDNSIVFNIYIICLGMIDQDWVEEAEDEIYNGDNEHDVMNEQLFVMVGFIESLRRGSLYRSGIRLNTQPTAQPINSFDDSQVAGWASDVRIEIAKDFSIC